MKNFLLLILLTLLAVEMKAQSFDSEKILRDYFESYNQHQVEEVLKMISEDFKMFSVTADTTTIDIEGKENLRDWLTQYFRDLPNVSSEISDVNESGNYISFTETAHWGEGKSQSSLAVYEFLDQKINRVWYYY